MENVKNMVKEGLITVSERIAIGVCTVIVGISAVMAIVILGAIGLVCEMFEE